MRVLTLFLLSIFLYSCAAVPQQTGPRLAVVVSFDQMRGDMPKRFERFFGEGGFRLIERRGLNYTECYYELANMMTGPGHAVLLTGEYPNVTGVTTNDLCDRSIDNCFYCAADTTGTRSAFALKVPTVGDELRAQNPESKVVSIATKDRSAILMGGRNTTATIWLNYRTGLFATSSAFTTPEWLNDVAHKHSLYRFADSTWRARIPIELDPAHDLVEWEGKMSDGTSTFPYALGDPETEEFMTDILVMPFSAQAVFEAATEIVELEQLGMDDDPDILTIGISTTDFTGHLFGPESREVEEVFVACDELLATFIRQLDERVGKENYVLFVTSDHGVSPVPESLTSDVRPGEPTIDAGRIAGKLVHHVIDSALVAAYGEAPSGSWIWEQHLPSVYLNHHDLSATGVNPIEAQRIGATAISGVNGIGVVVTHQDLVGGSCPPRVDAETCKYLQNAFDTDRSGDILVYPKRYWIFGSKPATHGTFHDYDRWVPLMVMGNGIPQGEVATTVAPTMIATMLRELYGIKK